MNCMKCGRETQDDQVFCAGCLQVMAEYPVDQDAPIQLPRRNTSSGARKQSRRRTPSPEERLVILTRRVRALTIALVILILLSGALGYACFYLFTTGRPRRGQNYTSIPQNPPATTSAAVNSDE